MAIVMLHYLTGGAWGIPIRRLLESGTRTLPLVAILFLPIAFGLRRLYPWSRPEVVAQDHLIAAKHAYLNVPFFLGRAIFYFAAWIGVAYFLNRWSRGAHREARLSRADCSGCQRRESSSTA
jgi:hypothetical protein